MTALMKDFFSAKFKTIIKHLNVIGCYAPTEDFDENKKDTFYIQLQNILNSVKKGDISLVLGDFNAKVGTDSDLWAGVLGPFGIGCSNGNGERLLQESSMDNTVEVDHSISCLESAVPDATQNLSKEIQVEKQKIIRLQEECDFINAKTESLRDETSKLDENTRMVYNRFTRTRENCDSLKKSNTLLEEHLNELLKAYAREEEKGNKDRIFYDEHIVKYQRKWEEHYTVYKRHPFMPEVNAKKRQLIELEEHVKAVESQLRQMQADLFRIKCERSRKNAEDSGFYPFEKFVIWVAQLRYERDLFIRKISELSEEISVFKAQLESIRQRKKEIHFSESQISNYSTTTYNLNKKTSFLGADISCSFAQSSNISLPLKESISENTNMITRKTDIPKIKLFVPQFSSKDNFEIQKCVPEMLITNLSSVQFNASSSMGNSIQLPPVCEVSNVGDSLPFAKLQSTATLPFVNKPLSKSSTDSKVSCISNNVLTDSLKSERNYSMGPTSDMKVVGNSTDLNLLSMENSRNFEMKHMITTPSNTSNPKISLYQNAAPTTSPAFEISSLQDEPSTSVIVTPEFVSSNGSKMQDAVHVSTTSSAPRLNSKDQFSSIARSELSEFSPYFSKCLAITEENESNLVFSECFTSQEFTSQEGISVEIKPQIRNEIPQNGENNPSSEFNKDNTSQSSCQVATDSPPKACSSSDTEIICEKKDTTLRSVSPFDFDKHFEILKEMKKSPTFNYSSRNMFESKDDQPGIEDQTAMDINEKTIGDSVFYDTTILNEAVSFAETNTSQSPKPEEFSFSLEKYCDSPKQSTSTEKSLFGFGAQSPQMKSAAASMFELFGTGDSEQSTPPSSHLADDFLFHFGSTKKDSPQAGTSSSFKFSFMS